MAEPFSFEVIAADSTTEARAGRITTMHGMIDTPVNGHTIGFAHKFALANARPRCCHPLYICLHNRRPDVGNIFWNLTDGITALVEQFFNDSELF